MLKRFKLDEETEQKLINDLLTEKDLQYIIENPNSFRRKPLTPNIKPMKKARTKRNRRKK